MREVNKDLKLHFSKLQRRIDELEARDREHGYFVAEQPSKRNRRYDSSEEEEEAVRKHSRDRSRHLNQKSSHQQRIEFEQDASSMGLMRRSGASDKENKRGTNLI